MVRNILVQQLTFEEGLKNIMQVKYGQQNQGCRLFYSVIKNAVL